VRGLQQHLLHAKPSEIAKSSRIFDDSSLQRVVTDVITVGSLRYAPSGYWWTGVHAVLGANGHP